MTSFRKLGLQNGKRIGDNPPGPDCLKDLFGVLVEPLVQAGSVGVLVLFWYASALVAWTVGALAMLLVRLMCAPTNNVSLMNPAGLKYEFAAKSVARCVATPGGILPTGSLCRDPSSVSCTGSLVWFPLTTFLLGHPISSLLNLRCELTICICSHDWFPYWLLRGSL